MKWTKETQVYMWAHYYSEDGKWMAWDVEERIAGGSRKKWYNPRTRKMENEDAVKHFWKLKDLKSGVILDQEFKTLKAAKEFAESHAE